MNKCDRCKPDSDERKLIFDYLALLHKTRVRAFRFYLILFLAIFGGILYALIEFLFQLPSLRETPSSLSTVTLIVVFIVFTAAYILWFVTTSFEELEKVVNVKINECYDSLKQSLPDYKPLFEVSEKEGGFHKCFQNVLCLGKSLPVVVVAAIIICIIFTQFFFCYLLHQPSPLTDTRSTPTSSQSRGDHG